MQSVAQSSAGKRKIPQVIIIEQHYDYLRKLFRVQPSSNTNKKKI